MSKSKWAVFTDLHLGIHQNSSIWHNIGLKWVDWFVEDLKSKKIEQIIFTGDFFHSRSEISVNTIHAAATFLEKLKDFKLWMIVGNHDSYYKQKAEVHSLSILNGYSNVTIFDKVSTQKIANKTVTFCPWGFNYDDIVDSDVIFGHFEIESFQMNAHKLCEEGIKPKHLLNKAPIIFSGHFHMNEEREYENGKIIYIGSPFQLDFGERDCQKGYYIIDFETLDYSFNENIITPVHKKFLISEIIEKDEQEYLSLIKNNFIRLVIDTKIEQKKLDELVHIINSYSPASFTVDPLINYDLVAEQESADLSGIDISKAIVEFVNLLDIQQKEEVVKRTLFLYNQTLKHD
jgi:DNA repair exonuclease SbcCD nuclease subunit